MEITQTDLRQTGVLVTEINNEEELYPLFDIDILGEAIEVYQLLKSTGKKVKLTGLWRFENLKTISAMKDFEVLLHGYKDNSIRDIY